MAKRVRARRAVQLTRAHLEMLKHFAAPYVSTLRYAAHCLHVRRSGEDVSVQACNGPMAVAMPALLVDAAELPVGLGGREIKDGEVIVVKPEMVADVLRTLPKKHPIELLHSAYMSVEDGAACVAVFKPEGQIFRSGRTDLSPIPDTHEQVQPAGCLRLRLNAKLFKQLGTFLCKHTQDADLPCFTLDFSIEADGVVRVLTRVEATDGFLAVVAPIRTRCSKPDGTREPAFNVDIWQSALQSAKRKLCKLEEDADG